MKLDLSIWRGDELLEEFKIMSTLIGRRGLSPNLYLGYGIFGYPPIIYGTVMVAKNDEFFNYIWFNKDIIDADRPVKLGWIKASGADSTYFGTILRTLGEALERFALMVYKGDNIVFTSAHELERKGEKYVDLSKYPCFAEKQLKKWSFLANFTEKDKKKVIGWVKGVELLTGDEIWVPAQTVYLNYIDVVSQRLIKGGRPEPMYYPTTSSGAAAGTSLEDAIYKGLLELIERDAFMKTWMCKLPPVARVQFDPYQDFGYLWSPRMPIEVKVFDISKVDRLSAFIGVAVNREDKRPKFVMGGASGIDPVDGVKKAYIEALHGLGYVRLFKIYKNQPAESINIQEVMNFEDNVLYYTDPKVFDTVRFLVETENVESMSDLRKRYAATKGEILEALRRNGYNPVYVDATPESYKDLGIYVVKVVDPKFVPLTPPAIPPLIHPSLDEWCGVGERNEMPHPYP